MSLVEKALMKFKTQQPGTARQEAPTVLGRIADGAPPAREEHALLHPSRTVMIDRIALRTAGFLPPEHQERRLADQYRQIKRPVLGRAFGRGAVRVVDGNMVGVTSSFPGEGKTFTSINLALSISRERDTCVLLVDGDVARMHLSKMFGIEELPGLMDALGDDAVDIESLCVGTDVQGLFLLSSGRRPDNATELLASERMRQAFATLLLRHQNLVVLFDCPPLIPTVEARTLAQAVGQIVLVVHAGVTQQSAVLDSIEFLGEGKPIGLVLNQSEHESETYRYYGGSTYGAEPATPGS
jgi:protein-tyrosine kinase